MQSNRYIILEALKDNHFQVDNEDGKVCADLLLPSFGNNKAVPGMRQRIPGSRPAWVPKPWLYVPPEQVRPTKEAAGGRGGEAEEEERGALRGRWSEDEGNPTVLC
ncbi:hypothetical protein BC937DRAFT_89183 [Endogone sp. FLAS-F59071]|nr:hypothetical protein BC937DRAFT_89183 [Endogone sp. FLAS-F59071]|eukprot:RUS18062.1 hypothetical protein BC937DRAFT_89183 [Endogone sp. FLAS-F59071]